MSNHIVRDGAHGHASFTGSYLQPYFEDGTIPPFPGADYYAVCYGELCAYADRPADDPACAAAGHHKLLAVWSVEVPGCEDDVKAVPPPYAGEWEPE